MLSSSALAWADPSEPRHRSICATSPRIPALPLSKREAGWSQYLTQPGLTSVSLPQKLSGPFYHIKNTPSKPHTPGCLEKNSRQPHVTFVCVHRRKKKPGVGTFKKGAVALREASFGVPGVKGPRCWDLWAGGTVAGWENSEQTLREPSMDAVFRVLLLLMSEPVLHPCSPSHVLFHPSPQWGEGTNKTSWLC